MVDMLLDGCINKETAAGSSPRFSQHSDATGSALAGSDIASGRPGDFGWYVSWVKPVKPRAKFQERPNDKITMSLYNYR